jgi:alpha-tubulin suppressor-like RCC1 family protein
MDVNNLPVNVTGLDAGVSAIAAGDGHTCALTADGMFCWGYDGNGAMGTGTLDNATTPVPVQ